MSDTLIIRTLLVGDAAVAATVPPERVFYGVAPQGCELPALVINTISNMELSRRLQDSGTVTRKKSRTQVTVLAKSYLQQKDVLRLVGLAIKGGRRTVAGVLVANIVRDIEGPDMRDDDAKIFMQTRDFRVDYYEPL